MRREDTVQLNAHSVAGRIEELGLKQWWLARMIGVDRKTVGRWVSGKVKRIARHNAEALGQYLECDVAEITISDEADVYATREEQRIAAELLHEKDIVQLLAPSDNWELAESLIKATMQPYLPLKQLGRLYNLLSTAVWRQGNYNEGLRYAERALEIGERIDDKAVISKATLNHSTILWFSGDLNTALAELEQCARCEHHFEDRVDFGKTLSNLAMSYHDFCRFEESEAAQYRAIDVFGELGLDLNLAIAYIGLAGLLTETGRLDDAEVAVARADSSAKKAEYQYGALSILFYKADIASLRNDFEEAEENISIGLNKLAEFDVYNLYCNEITARFYRRVGRYDEATATAKDALEASEPFDFVYARMLQERARLASAIGNVPEGERYRRKANTVFDNLGIPRRVKNEPLAEFGKMFE